MSKNLESPFVESSMRDAGIAPLDERGLMPLADARSFVQAATEFRKGRYHPIGDQLVLDSDLLWAALISLEDVEEFVREATRIRWFFHPRGEDNLAAFERYGEAILPWLASFVRSDGRLVNVPWCVRPCLMRIGSEEAFDLLWSVTCISDGVGDESPGPFASDNPGDADRRSGTNLDAVAPPEADDDASGLVIEWLYSNPELGFPLIARVAKGGDARAQRILKSLAQCAPQEIFGYVKVALGESESRAIFALSDAPAELDEECITVKFSIAAEMGLWPSLFSDRPETAYHAMRLIAVRAIEGDGWGVIFERIEGASSESATVRSCLYGPYLNGARVAWEPNESLPFSYQDDAKDRRENSMELDGVHVDGPAGASDLSTSMIAERDLRPGLATAEGVTSSRFSLILRAYLSEHPEAFWREPGELVPLLVLGEDAEVLFVSETFQHCVGEAGPEVYPSAWKIRPEVSVAFRSLAKALVARDPALFEPGESNLDFRLHALAPVPGEGDEEA